MRDGTYKGKGDTIVTVPVSPELHRRLRMHAAAEGRTIKWIVTKLIERHLASIDWLAENSTAVDQDHDLASACLKARAQQEPQP